MNRSRNFVWLTVVVVAAVWMFTEVRIQANAPIFGDVGADVIVGDLPSTSKYGPVGSEVAYAVATTSCNIGDVPLNWFASTDQHPVISQNLYRVKNGRIEHLGQSWLKHAFAALTGSLCGTCQSPGTSQLLGVGCSDPYTANRNGTHFRLGPKSEVNAATGVFVMPHRDLTNQQDGTLDGRIRVPVADVSPNSNPGASFFIESQYVTPDDTAAGNSTNSTSYREVTVSGSLNLNVSGPTVRMLPAIHAWQAVHPDVELTNIDVPGDGRIVVGIRTTESGDGFHTEIAIQNQTSDRCVRSLGVDCCSGSISNEGFNDVDYQFEDYADADWTPSISGSDITWATETFAENVNANAIRWGTLYSFWFDSEKRPRDLTLGLFKPGKPDSYTIVVSEVIMGDANDDGEFNNNDISSFVLALTDPVSYQTEFPDADPDCALDMNGDGVFNNQDIAGFVSALTGSGKN